MASTKSIRQIKLVDMVKRNNEDGTAFSEAERKKWEDLTIPGYEQLEVLMSSATTVRRDKDYATSWLYKTCENLKAMLPCKDEDNDCPFHRSLDTVLSLRPILVFDTVSKASKFSGTDYAKARKIMVFPLDEIGGDGGLFVLSSGEDDDEEMEDGKDDDGDKAEEVVSNRELAEMLPTKTMKKSKKRG
ncbi:hypothetical protein BT69DRAFT_1336802 [Atractiella rhizophila]|nr:hypothetical protein BT69DRAFT_1336802 [Atractiella rhizophila]